MSKTRCNNSNWCFKNIAREQRTKWQEGGAYSLYKCLFLSLFSKQENRQFCLQDLSKKKQLDDAHRKLIEFQLPRIPSVPTSWDFYLWCWNTHSGSQLCPNLDYSKGASDPALAPREKASKPLHYSAWFKYVHSLGGLAHASFYVQRGTFIVRARSDWLLDPWRIGQWQTAMWVSVLSTWIIHTKDWVSIPD